LKHHLLLASSLVLMFAVESFAAPVSIYGPQKFNASPKTKEYQVGIPGPGTNKDGVLTITNGDGQDLSPVTCAGNFVQRVHCGVENLKKVILSEIQRPEKPEIYWNGQLIASSSTLPQTKGKLQIAIKVRAQNTLKVRLQGLPISYLSVEIKSESTASNQMPIARITATPTTGIAPELISFSGLASSDPDASDTIANYEWDFGDGSFATGALVTHNFILPGTYNVKLTVTDSKGGQGSVTQSLVINQNQLPVASFVAATDTALGVLKARFDASASTDADNTIQEFVWNFGDQSAEIVGTAAVVNHVYANPGTYNVVLKVKDSKGGIGTTSQQVVVQDTAAPLIEITSPQSGAELTSLFVNVTGSANEPLSEVTAKLTGGETLFLNIGANQKFFSGSLPVVTSGAQTLTVTSKDLAGNSTTGSVSFVVNANFPPIAQLKVTIPPSNVAPLMVLFDASASSSPQAKALHYEFDFDDGASVQSANGIISHQFENAGQYQVKVTVIDSSGAQAEKEFEVIAVNPGVPPSPITQVPPIANLDMSAIANAVKFLYTGENPIQTGLMVGALDPDRTVVLQGTVLDQDQNPISGVKVTVLENPELGRTLTTTEGKFYLVANGGGTLTVSYERNGYFPVQRKVKTSALDYFSAEKIIMVKPDEKVSQILNNSSEIQVVKGSSVSDESGTRTAVLMIPPNTVAKLQMPDGTLKNTSTLSIRATEYTVGADGLRRMPADLPTRTGYTYAVELSADEAIASGASHVVFSQAVPFYVDNFLNLPPGSAVPVGSYNSKLGAWDAENDGVVLRVLQIQNGKAVLSADTSGNAATENQLLRLKITEGELQKIAESYSPGQSFWRAQLMHMSPYDLNFTVTLPPPAPPGPPASVSIKKPPCTSDGETTSYGSIIDLRTCGLGEELSLPGIPTNLHYTTLTKPGRLTERTVTIPLYSGVFPSSSSITNIHLKVEIAGQVYEQDFAPQSDLSTTYVWNGMDVFGRRIHGGATARIAIDYEGSNFYQIGPFSFLVDAKSFGAGFISFLNQNIAARRVAKVTKNFSISVGHEFPVNTLDVGGWSLTQVHRYNPLSKTLFLGNGDTIDGSNMAPIVNAIAGSHSAFGYSGDNGLAVNARFYNPTAIAIGPDGSIFVADQSPTRIRKISPDGTIQTIAGNGQMAAPVDGSVATESPIYTVRAMAVLSDGSLIYTDSGLHKIRKISPDGYTSTIAGSSDFGGFSGDGGPAILAKLASPGDIAVAGDGSIYFTDAGNVRIRKIAPNGMISTIAGNGTSESTGDGGSALLAGFKSLSLLGLAIGPNNEIYVSDASAHVIRVITVDGIIQHFAGVKGNPGADGDSGLARTSRINNPRSIEVDQEGSVYFVDYGNARIRKVTSDGQMTTIVGNDGTGSEPNFSISTIAKLTAVFPETLKLYRRNSFLYTQQLKHAIEMYHDALPDLDPKGYTFGSTDGSEIFQFSATGRHMQTLYVKTGKIKWKFTYDTSGRILQIRDGVGKVTTIERDQNGIPLSIRGPFGHMIALETNADGYLTAVSQPTGETTRMSYDSGGLLLEFRKPSGHASTFEYNASGELKKDTDAAGGFKALNKVAVSNVKYIVTETTAMGRQKKLQIDTSTLNNNEYLTTFSNGNTVRQIVSQNSIQIVNSHGSSVGSSARDIDPRLGGITQFFSFQNTSSPVESNNRRTSTVYTPLSATDFFNFVQVSKETIDTGTVTTTYNSQQRSISSVTGNGRSKVEIIDDLERPVTIQVGNFQPIQYSYLPNGQLSSTMQGDRLTQFTYNSLGQLESVTDPEGQVTGYQWDASNRLLQTIRPDNQVTNMTYDLNSNLSGVQPPEKLMHTILSNVIDLFSVYTPPSVPGAAGGTSYTYNLDRQLIAEAKPDGNTLEYTYDPVTGNLIKVKGALKSITYEFRSASNTVPEESLSSDGVRILITPFETFHLDRRYQNAVVGRVQYIMGRRKEISQININDQVHISQLFDADMYLTQAGDLTIERDVASGVMTGNQIGNVQESIEYNTFGEIAETSVSVAGAPLFSTQLTRDKLGRITNKTEDIQGQVSNFSYTYDLAGRLTNVSTNGVLSSHYVYDTNGNRLSENLVTASYDAQDRLVQYGDAAYSYTANGTLLQKSVGSDITKYLYDDFGQLAKVTLPTGKVIDYLIDGEKHRAVKKVNEIVTTKFIYHSNGNLAAELNPDNSLKWTFVYGTQSHSPDYMIAGSLKYRFIKDHLGSIRLVVNTVTGAIVQKIDYDAFGKVIVDTSPGLQPLGYAGGIYDQDTGLMRFGVRDYDPETGRWTSKDPIRFAGGDPNLYAYTGNDPVNKIDPNGKISCHVIATISNVAAVASLRYEKFMLLSELDDLISSQTTCAANDAQKKVLYDRLDQIDREMERLTTPSDIINEAVRRCDPDSYTNLPVI